MTYQDENALLQQIRSLGGSRWVCADPTAHFRRVRLGAMYRLPVARQVRYTL